MHRVVVIALVLFIIVFVGTASASPVRLALADTEGLLNGHVSWVIDQTGNMDIDQAISQFQSGKFTPIPNSEVNAGYLQNQALWLHFSVIRDEAAPKQWWLAIPQDIIEHIDVYTEQADGSYLRKNGGRALAFAQREVDWHGHAFQLLFDDSLEHHIYIRLTSTGTMRPSLRLWQQHAFEHFRVMDNLLLGAFFGIMGIALIISLYRTLYYRSAVDVSYTLYIFGLESANFLAFGFFQQLGLSDNLQLRIHLAVLGLMTASITMIWFFIKLVEWPPALSATINKMLTGYTLLYVPTTLILMAMKPAIEHQFVITLSIPMLLTVLVGGIFATWRGYGSARLFTLAFAPFVIIILVFVLGSLGLVQGTWVLRNAFLVTTLFHTLLLFGVVLSRDANQRKLAEGKLRVTAIAFETLDEAVVITDVDTTILQTNQAFERVTGYSEADVIGKNLLLLGANRQDPHLCEYIWREVGKKGCWHGEIWDVHKNGHKYPAHLNVTAVKDNHGKTVHYVSAIRDISELKKVEEELQNMAFYDALTGLPNRRLLRDRINLAIALSERNKQYGALLFLDIDNFKLINDSQGHEGGDILLVDVSQRLKFCVREVDTVARIGGDEFVVLIENMGLDMTDAIQHAAHIAEKIRMALTIPYQINTNEFHTSPSIGISIFCGDNEAEELLKRADIAMYAAKTSGRNLVRFFNPELQQLVESRAGLESALHEAVIKQQFRLFYQIQVDNDLKPIGAEALIRWELPLKGMISPAKFIPVAEESGLILKIGHWVLNTACKQLALWSQNPQTSNLDIAVNISARHFKQADFVEQMQALLAQHHINPARLKLELTESVALDDLDAMVNKMLELKNILGVKLSLDDFGTGFSSLSYLKRLPFDQIKIDQSFVRDISTDANDALMVETIIYMANNFGFHIIAEGVETEAQLAFLKQHNCMAYQGYLFGKPVPIEQFELTLGQLRLDQEPAILRT